MQESNPYINELWGTEKEAGTFRITRKGNYYIICDVNTKRILSENDSNLLEFTNNQNALWRLTRNKKAVEKGNLQVLSNLIPLGQASLRK